MKNLAKYILILCGLFFFSQNGNAQNLAKEVSKLDMGIIKPYRLEITLYKTSHLIFPSTIRYVDLGSGYLTAAKADDTGNVLRVQASEEFEQETNFSVITEDGRFYSFNAAYSSQPSNLNYNFLSQRENPVHEVLFADLGSESPKSSQDRMKTLLKENKKSVRAISSQNSAVKFILKGIYTHEGKYYLHLEIRNKSHLPFATDFISFSISDRKKLKRVIAQETVIEPVRVSNSFTKTAGKSTSNAVFLFDQFSFSKDKRMRIKIYEKKGSRHQSLSLKNARLMKAKMLKE
jgi:conjugative transposon TraN protein